LRNIEQTGKIMTEVNTAAPAGYEARLAKAKRQVAARKGFYVHLGIYAVILTGLFVLNLAAGREWWVHWVFAGWGIGVVAHALAVFGRQPRAVVDWEERELNRIMNERTP
jgi:hypothetical protein